MPTGAEIIFSASCRHMKVSRDGLRSSGNEETARPVISNIASRRCSHRVICRLHRLPHIVRRYLLF